MNIDDLLLDQIDMFGSSASSIFVHLKRHQGNILKKTGSLVWLHSIYNVDLNTNTYKTDYNTDLHEIAKEIMDNHDVNYKH